MNQLLSKEVTNIGYLAFNNLRPTLPDGVYLVKEFDGDRNYVVIGNAGRFTSDTARWFTPAEFEEAKAEYEAEERYARSMEDGTSEFFDSIAYGIGEGEGDELSDAEFNRLREQALESNQRESETFDKSMEQKSLADLLREAMAKDQRDDIN